MALKRLVVGAIMGGAMLAVLGGCESPSRSAASLELERRLDRPVDANLVVQSDVYELGAKGLDHKRTHVVRGREWKTIHPSREILVGGEEVLTLTKTGMLERRIGAPQSWPHPAYPWAERSWNKNFDPDKGGRPVSSRQGILEGRNVEIFDVVSDSPHKGLGSTDTYWFDAASKRPLKFERSDEQHGVTQRIVFSYPPPTPDPLALGIARIDIPSLVQELQKRLRAKSEPSEDAIFAVIMEEGGRIAVLTPKPWPAFEVSLSATTPTPGVPHLWLNCAKQEGPVPYDVPGIYWRLYSPHPGIKDDEINHTPYWIRIEAANGEKRVQMIKPQSVIRTSTLRRLFDAWEPEFKKQGGVPWAR